MSYIRENDFYVFGSKDGIEIWADCKNNWQDTLFAEDSKSPNGVVISEEQFRAMIKSYLSREENKEFINELRNN